MSKSTIEVLNFVRGVNVVTGEDLVSIQFGKVARKANNTQKIQMSPFGAVGSPVSVVLTLFFKFEEAAPYKVGSQWSSTVSENGSLQLQEAKE